MDGRGGEGGERAGGEGGGRVCQALGGGGGEGGDVYTLMQKMMKGPMPIRNPYHPQNLINERREDRVVGRCHALRTTHQHPHTTPPPSPD